MWWSYPGPLTKSSMEITVFLVFYWKFLKSWSTLIPQATFDTAGNGHLLIAMFWEQQVKCHVVQHRKASQQSLIQLKVWHYSYTWHHQHKLLEQALPGASLEDLLDSQGDSCPTFCCGKLTGASLPDLTAQLCVDLNSLQSPLKSLPVAVGEVAVISS